MLDVKAILGEAVARPARNGRRLLGHSREGRPIHGWLLGTGERVVSLIGGCHADEPVGPATLDRLLAWLQRLPGSHPLLSGWRWLCVPHANPDGEQRNQAWVRRAGPVERWPEPDRSFDLASYLSHAVRESPPDDVEFGFPRTSGEPGVRPENQCVARFMAEQAPLSLHASLHGMGFAAGPWFLLEPAWETRTLPLRERLRAAVAELGLQLHDVDRGGDKGFRRIDRGFSTRPDSRAMARHFRDRGQPERAELFRPSSMEHARSLGGDPLTLVTEMPLFVLPSELFPDSGARPALVAELQTLALSERDDQLSLVAADAGLRPLPTREQMHVQLLYLDAALEAVVAA